MTWLVWRQHRIQFLVSAALLAAFAVLIVITGAQVANQYHAAQAACAAGQGCHTGGGLFLGSHAVGFLIISTLGAPVLAGLFFGAPLVAAEAEAGTTQFAWMQSVTRRRWVAVKVGWMLLAAAVWGGAISALVTWPGRSTTRRRERRGPRRPACRPAWRPRSRRRRGRW